MVNYGGVITAVSGLRRTGQTATAGSLTKGLHGRDGFQGHVAGTLDGPFVVLLKPDGADEAGDGRLVGV